MPVVKNQTIRTYEVKLTSDQPVHVGALKDPMTDIDNPVVLVGGRPAIPGSSLKGALRAQLEEYLILNHADSASYNPCLPSTFNNLSQDENKLIPGKYKGAVCGYNPKGNNPVKICPACYLLGTAGLVGFVQVPYLYADADVEEGYAARRDRASNIVATGANRSIQHLPPGTPFTGTLYVLVKDKIRGWELGRPRSLGNNHYSDAWLQNSSRSLDDIVKDFLIDRLESIRRIGGKYSVGMGQVTIKVTPLPDIEV